MLRQRETRYKRIVDDLVVWLSKEHVRDSNVDAVLEKIEKLKKEPKRMNREKKVGI